MDTGLFLALIAAVVFAAGIVLVRKTAGDVGESFSVTAISIFIGIPFYAIVITASGDWGKILIASWKPLLMLCSAGVIHFLIGRLAGYNSFRLIGANRATPITQISPIYTVLLSWIFIDEKPTIFIIFGALCMLTGVFLISQSKSSITGTNQKASRDELKGILLALVSSLCWGISPILIKPSVSEIGSSVLGNFISYSAAGVIMLLLFTDSTRRMNFARLSFKRNMLPMVIAGLFTATGQLLYFMALGKSPANVVSPLVSIEILFIFVMSFLVNRRGEVFTLKVVLGMLAAVVGTFLLFQ